MEKSTFIVSNIGDVRAAGFREFKSLVSIKDTFVKPPKKEEKERPITPTEELLSVVFAVNPVTKLPEGYYSP